MRAIRYVGWLAGALLMLTLLLIPAAASQGGPQIQDVSITSATVDRGGTVRITGYLWCSQPMDVQSNGQVQQVIGRKTMLQGGWDMSYSGMPCNGLTPWQMQTQAWNGLFSAGWATVNVNFQGAFWCDDPYDQNTCYFHAGGGTQQYLKITAAKGR